MTPQAPQTDIPASIQLMESDPELYEQYILAAVDKDEELWGKMCNLLCWDSVRNVRVNDFTRPLHYAIFMAMCGWRDIRREAGLDGFAPMSQAGISFQLQALSQQAVPVIDEDNINDATQLYLAIQESIGIEEARTITAHTWRTWLGGRRALLTMQHIQRVGTVNVQQALSDLVRANEHITTSQTDDDTCAEFGDGMDRGDVFVERILLGPRFLSLNKCLGGGLGKTEHIMFISPTGAGKTVLACQLAADIASQNKHVLLVSTEQPFWELEPRILSAVGSTNSHTIPFNLIKDGGDYQKILTETQYAQCLGVRDVLRGWLHFEDWLGTGRSVCDDLDALVKNKIKKYGSLDVVILDWIGGALVQGISDPNIRRQLYLDAAYTMKVIAAKYNIACVSMAQATADAVGVKRITEKYIAECKTIHREAVAGFGISALRTEGSDEEEASYADNQWVYCFKSRKAIGKCFPVVRNFGLQRFEKM